MSNSDSDSPPDGEALRPFLTLELTPPEAIYLKSIASLGHALVGALSSDQTPKADLMMTVLEDNLVATMAVVIGLSNDPSMTSFDEIAVALSNKLTAVVKTKEASQVITDIEKRFVTHRASSLFTG